jgi:hypothetical protein
MHLGVIEPHARHLLGRGVDNCESCRSTLAVYISSVQMGCLTGRRRKQTKPAPFAESRLVAFTPRGCRVRWINVSRASNHRINVVERRLADHALRWPLHKPCLLTLSAQGVPHCPEFSRKNFFFVADN